MRVQNPWAPSGGRSAGRRTKCILQRGSETRVTQPGEIMVTHGNMCTVATNIRMIRFAVISETDVFGQEQKKEAPETAAPMKVPGKLPASRDLTVGDYVVHENHGLGIYRGIEKIDGGSDRQRLYED